MSRRKRGGRKRGTLHVQKRSKALESLVHRVGPERFGILAVDSAKHRFSLCLANFYAEVLEAPFVVENTRSAWWCGSIVMASSCLPAFLRGVRS
jgi:hypothetical protein